MLPNLARFLQTSPFILGSQFYQHLHNLELVQRKKTTNETVRAGRKRGRLWLGDDRGEAERSAPSAAAPHTSATSGNSRCPRKLHQPRSQQIPGSAGSFPRPNPPSLLAARFSLLRPPSPWPAQADLQEHPCSRQTTGGEFHRRALAFADLEPGAPSDAWQRVWLPNENVEFTRDLQDRRKTSCNSISKTACKSSHTMTAKGTFKNRQKATI